MVVLLEKDTVPPPPYFASEHTRLPFSPSPSSLGFYRNNGASLPATSAVQSSGNGAAGRSRAWKPAPPLPSHVLLLITYHTLPTPTDTVPIRQSYIGLDGSSAVRVVGRRKMDAREFAVRTTRVLYWMGFCLRGVCRGFYLAAMHILRSTFLPHYLQYIRPPYTSDPFPHTSTPPLLTSHQPHPRPHSIHSSSSSSRSTSLPRLRSHSQPGSGLMLGPVVPASAAQPESEVLDRFVLFQLHEDVFSDDSALHLTARPDTLRDLFDFMQPRARLADLVRMYGAHAGVLVEASPLGARSESSQMRDENVDDEEDEGEGWAWVERGEEELGMLDFLRLSEAEMSELGVGPAQRTSEKTIQTPPAKLPAKRCRRQRRVHASALRATFSSRNVGLVYVPSGRTIVQVPREREESLERSASHLVRGLKGWLTMG